MFLDRITPAALFANVIRELGWFLGELTEEQAPRMVDRELDRRRSLLTNDAGDDTGDPGLAALRGEPHPYGRETRSVKSRAAGADPEVVDEALDAISRFREDLTGGRDVDVVRRELRWRMDVTDRGAEVREELWKGEAWPESEQTPLLLLPL